mmetsp:Transcript_16865/g.51949  ORF Transcript_16865/g.51949 Transcript_16865/m.51949 type:complete len:265 (+) Transcript_16865:244-1038(+)
MLEKCLHVVINARRQLVAVPADPALNVPKGKLDGVEDKGVGGEKFNDSTRRPYVLHPVVIVVDGAVVQYHDTMLVRLVVLLQIGNNVLSHCGCKRLCVVASLDDVHLPQHAVDRVAADHRVLLLAEFEHTPSGAFTPDRSSKTTLCCLVVHTRLRVEGHDRHGCNTWAREWAATSARVECAHTAAGRHSPRRQTRAGEPNTSAKSCRPIPLVHHRWPRGLQGRSACAYSSEHEAFDRPWTEIHGARYGRACRAGSRRWSSRTST